VNAGTGKLGEGWTELWNMNPEDAREGARDYVRELTLGPTPNRGGLGGPGPECRDQRRVIAETEAHGLLFDLQGDIARESVGDEEVVVLTEHLVRPIGLSVTTEIRFRNSGG
jgi:hypothetical protein